MSAWGTYLTHLHTRHDILHLAWGDSSEGPADRIGGLARRDVYARWEGVDIHPIVTVRRHGSALRWWSRVTLRTWVFRRELDTEIPSVDRDVVEIADCREGSGFVVVVDEAEALAATVVRVEFEPGVRV